MLSKRARLLSLAGVRSMSSGLAHTLGVGTLDAKINPLRSKMRPRLAGSSSTRMKRKAPCFLKNALSMTCT